MGYNPLSKASSPHQRKFQVLLEGILAKWRTKDAFLATLALLLEALAPPSEDVWS